MMHDNELFVTEGPYDPGVIGLANAIDTMASMEPIGGSFRQALRTAAAQIRVLTAQRDELREAGCDAIAVMVSVDPMDYSGARRSAIERLRAAVDGAL